MFSSEDFTSGHIALDFLNTVSGSDKSREMSRIASWSDFIRWAVASDGFVKADLTRIRAASRKGEDLAALHDFRETAFAALGEWGASGISPGPQWIPMQSKIQTVINQANLVVGANGVEWQGDPSSAHWVQDRMVLAFHDLLTGQDLKRLKECQRCSWLFLDHGRGRGRKWCDMSRCGNREKAQNFRARHAP